MTGEPERESTIAVALPQHSDAHGAADAKTVVIGERDDVCREEPGIGRCEPVHSNIRSAIYTIG